MDFQEGHDSLVIALLHLQELWLSVQDLHNSRPVSTYSSQKTDKWITVSEVRKYDPCNVHLLVFKKKFYSRFSDN